MSNWHTVVTMAISSALIGYAADSTAHHGPHAEPLYDTSGLVEFEGEVTEVFWRNPHARFRIRVTSGPETGEIWQIETNPPANLRRNGFAPELMPIGSEVKVAGVVSRRKPRHMGLFNLLLPNGLEFADVSRPNPLRFSDRRLDQRLNLQQTQAGNDQPGSVQVEAAIRDANGIFRVWQRDRTPFGSLDVDPDTQPASPLGYSVGKWEDDTLVVTTTRIDSPLSNNDGVPQSAEAIHIERFTPAADGSTMDYELMSVDPAYLIGAPIRPGTFTWRPGREIGEFGCTVWE